MANDWSSKGCAESSGCTVDGWYEVRGESDVSCR